jgi:outer membrane immunogenic protein
VNKLVASLCITAVGALSLAGAAKAQEFKGFYVGGNFGGEFQKAKTVTTTVFSNTGYFAQSSVDSINGSGTQHPDPQGFVGGGQVGYNFQHNALVFGGEFDFGGSNLDHAKSITVTYPDFAPTSYTIAQRVKSDWLMTARGKAGVAVGRLLVYGTAGLAVTNLNYTEAFSDTFDSASESGQIKKSKTGWTVGGGAELALSRHLSVKGEYLYADFGKSSTTSTNLTTASEGPFPDSVFTHSIDLKTNVVRGGINIRF